MSLSSIVLPKRSAGGRRPIFSVLNLHILGLSLLVILNLVIGVRLLMAWHTLHAARPGEMEQQRASYRALELELLPLRGLPGKVDQAREQATQFYGERFPGAYSTISSTIGDLASKTQVRLTRVSYLQAPAISGLAEVRMDASLSGQYEPLMRFINSLERSKTFFLINDLTFTGEQGGMVNLRLRLTTFLYGPDVEHLAPPSSGGSDASRGEAF